MGNNLHVENKNHAHIHQLIMKALNDIAPLLFFKSSIVVDIVDSIAHVWNATNNHILERLTCPCKTVHDNMTIFSLKPSQVY